MDYTNTLYLPSTRRECLPIAPIRCMPGKVAVLMEDERQQEGSILLSDVAAGRLRPDCGIVAGVGDGRQHQRYKDDVPHIKVGDRVLVRPYSGIWETDLYAPYEVRFYGLAHAHDACQAVDWHDDIMAFEDEGDWWPTGYNLLVRRVRESHPLIPAEYAKWKDEGEVITQGPLIGERLVGQSVSFKAGLSDDVLGFAFGRTDDVFLVPLYCVLMVKE